MSSLQAGLSVTPAVLTVELALDPVTRGARPPAPLDRDQADRLAAAIADDLRKILGDIDDVGLVVVAALYDLTELLRPGLPILEVLLELYRGALPPTGFEPQILALGGQEGRFPIPAIAPARLPGSGPLLVLPFVFVGPQAAIESVQSRLESLLLEQGKASLATDRMVRLEFGLQPENLAYATVNDLAALLKIQLEHNDLAPLWQLLEGALYRPEQPQKVALPSGNLFFQRGHEVYTPFYTYDEWAGRGDAEPLQSYRDWMRYQRQYMAGLAAHGLSVQPTAPDIGLPSACENRGLELARNRVLDDAEVRREPATPLPDLSKARVIVFTEHADRLLGPVAYTAMVQSSEGEVLYLGNEYPLQPSGMASIRRRWAELGSAAGVELHLSQPGEIVVSEDGRHLVPFLDTEGGPH